MIAFLLAVGWTLVSASAFAAIGATRDTLGVPVSTLVVSDVACVGDCQGMGAVTVADLIVGVNIVLGSAAPDTCRALQDETGQVTVAQLVHAVGNSLNGCPATPTATGETTATASATAAPSSTTTPLDTPTASATPSPSAAPTGSITPPRTATPTISASSTLTATASATASPSQTAMSTASVTATSTATRTTTNTATRTTTATPTRTSSATGTATSSPTLTRTRSATATVTASQTSTPTPTRTASATITPTPSRTPTPSVTPTPGPVIVIFSLGFAAGLPGGTTILPFEADRDFDIGSMHFEISFDGTAFEFNSTIGCKSPEGSSLTITTVPTSGLLTVDIVPKVSGGDVTISAGEFLTCSFNVIGGVGIYPISVTGTVTDFDGNQAMVMYDGEFDISN